MDLDEIAVDNFRKYLRIPSVHPGAEYDECVHFLTGLAGDIGLDCEVLELVEKKPIVIMTYRGETSLPSIILNSHMDVVAVEREKWKYDPFGAEMDAEGNIYGRGAQDMKCVGIQHLEALRRLKMTNTKVKRDIYVVFVPDEEIGGKDGTVALIKSEKFKNMNAGFCLDEGYATEEDFFLLFNGSKAIWAVEFNCTGTGGHASLLLEDSPGEKLREIVEKVSDYRRKQVAFLKKNPQLDSGDITSVNLTMIEGGVQRNVIPSEMNAIYDFRVAVTEDEEKLEKKLTKWARKAGDGVELQFLRKDSYVEPTKLDDSNTFWKAFKDAFDKMNMKMKIGILDARPDSRYMQEIGIPALNFSPMNRTKNLMHTHNEYLNRKVFLEGIKIYENLIQAVANADQ